jgi:leucyl aminopeptidase (aminopeptidase T)
MHRLTSAPWRTTSFYTVQDGRITEIEGRVSAQKLRDFLEDKDSEAYGIAEFGIGTNPARKIIGHPLVDEKVWGTVHIAFGMNSSIGGVRSPISITTASSTNLPYGSTALKS